MRANRPVLLLSAGHACVDAYQGAVAALVPFFVAERAYGYATASGIVLAASLLSSVAQPFFGVLTDRRAIIWRARWLGSVEVRSYEPASLTRLVRTEYPDGTGDLVFEERITFVVRSIVR